MRHPSLPEFTARAVSRDPLPPVMDQLFENTMYPRLFSVLLSAGLAATAPGQVAAPLPLKDMVLIPAGSFEMGDSRTQAATPHTVYVSPFHMDHHEVTKALWDEVAIWGQLNGYDLVDLKKPWIAAARGPDYPVRAISWFNSLKWCNARSEKEGRTPVYTVGTGVYRNGISTPECNFGADGYRLPTEAEWEKAARGGLAGKRFPWGDTISHASANYVAIMNGWPYDLSPSEGYHPDYLDPDYGWHLAPVKSFPANGYGLFEVAGNLSEWCWDWFGRDYYSASPASDPHGPSSGTFGSRVLRGGNFNSTAPGCMVSARGNEKPSDENNGFRTVISAVQQPVVLIPGIAGSILKSGDRQIWPSINPVDVASLDLAGGPSGTEAVDVIREYDAGGLGRFVSHVYGPFLRHLVTDGGRVEFDLAQDRSRLTGSYMSTLTGPVRPDLFVFPYDWRRSNASHAATLHAFLQNISSLHQGAKINLVVHSMGGLVMRRYLLEYGPDLIGRVVTVGSPVWGAPESAYRMFTGIFYNFGPVDFINSRAMKQSVLSMPAVHELNPSTRYLQNQELPVFTERQGDYNGNGIRDEAYDAIRFRTALDELAHPQTPAVNNIRFHGYLAGRQDDWSHDSGPVKFLHITGRQSLDTTTTGIDVRCLTLFNPLSGLEEIQVFSRVEGVGDGTVPALGSQRLPEYLAPDTLMREIREPLLLFPSVQQPEGQAAEHTLLMSNTRVWGMIDTFLETGDVPPAESPAGPLLQSQSTAGKNRRQVLIAGCGRVAIRDPLSGEHNENLSAIAVKRIPGIDVTYNDDAGWVLLTCDADRDLTVESLPGAGAVEIEVTTRTSGGTAIELARYRGMEGSVPWQLALSSGQAPVLFRDMNRDGISDPGERVSAHYAASGPAVDVTAPEVELALSVDGDQIRMTAAARDSGPAVIRYQIDQGPLTTYTGPLLFPRTAGSRIRLYAEDAPGNTSGLIQTVLNPPLSIQAVPQTAFTLEWPAADGYRLETSATLQGPWAGVTDPQQRSQGRVSTTVMPNASTGFFRLAAHPVVR